MRRLNSVAALLLTALLARGAALGRADQSFDLSGTKPGPHYVIMTREERAAMRERVEKEAWAKELFQRDILPLADRLLDREKEQRQWQPGQRGGEEQGYVVYAAVAYLVTGQEQYLDAAWRRVKFQMDAIKRHKKEKLSFYWGVDHARTDVGVVYDLLADSLTPAQEEEIRGLIKYVLDASKEWHLSHSTNPNMKFHELAALGIWAYAIGCEEHIDWILDHESPKGQWCACGISQLMRDYILDGHLDNEGPYYSIYEAGTMSALAEASVRYGYKNFYELTFPRGGSLKHIMDGWFALAWPQWQDGKVNVAPSKTSGVVLAGTGPKDGVWEAGWPTGLLHRALTTRVRRFGDQPYMWFYSFEKEMDRRILVPQHRAWALVRRFDSSLDDLMYGRVQVPADIAPPSVKSSLFPEAGVVMLRSPESPQYWTRGTGVYLHGGEWWRLSMGLPMIMVHGAGALFYHDRYSYQYALTIGWLNTRLSKNTIIIDGRDGIHSRSVYRTSFAPEVKYASARCAPYLEAEMERALMLTDQYLLEVFHAVVDPNSIDPQRFWDYGRSVYWHCNATLAEGMVHHPGRPIDTKPRKMPRSHNFDYSLRSLGEIYPDNWGLYLPSDEYTLGYWPCRWLEKERKRVTDDDFLLDWVQKTKGETGIAGMRLRMLGERGTTIYIGDEPGKRNGIHVRRTGKEACFTVVHEPYRKEPLIRGLRYLNRPRDGQKNPSVGVAVSGPHYEDRLYMTLGLPGVTVPQHKRENPDILAGWRVVADLTKGWLFKTDPDQIGDRQGWHKEGVDRSDWMKARAGCDWKTFVPDYYGTAWYARTFVLSEKLKGEKATLHFAGADGDTVFYLNGRRIGSHPGEMWAEPVLVRLGDAARYGAENLLVVKMRKTVFQTGLYRKVQLVAAEAKGRGEAKKTEAPMATARPDPLVTLTDEDDPSQGISYRGQAYLRQSGGKLVARGRIEAFSIRAPKAKTLILNGEPTKCRVADGYVVYGKSRWKQGRKPRPIAREEKPEWIPALRARLPQIYVNLDAATGGAMKVAVAHPEFNTPSQAKSGRLKIVCPGIKVTPASVEVPALAPGQKSLHQFRLSGGEFGKAYSVTVRLYVREGAEERLAQTLKAEVVVGVLVKDVEQRYDRPMIKGDQGHRPMGKQKENFDRLQVRAPGYTIEIDRFSGTSRYIVDPAGNVRTTLGTWPYRFTRGKAFHGGGMADISAFTVWRSYEIPTVWVPDPEGETKNRAKRKKVFAFWIGAEFAGLGTDDESGHPTATWTTKDGLYEMWYVFHPEAVEVSVTKKEQAPAFKLDFSKLDVKDESYAYEAFVEGNTFGFKRGEEAK